MRAIRSARSSRTCLARLVRRGRELPALGRALVWIVGVVIAPLLHLAMHASLPAHEHGVVGTSRESRCHDDHCHEAFDPDEVDHEDARNDAPMDHARGSSLHGDVAAIFPAPAFVVPPFVAIGERATPPCTDDLAEALRALPRHARGPPNRVGA